MVSLGRCAQMPPPGALRPAITTRPSACESTSSGRTDHRATEVAAPVSVARSVYPRFTRRTWSALTLCNTVVVPLAQSMRTISAVTAESRPK
jgi:hypothetical protein